MQSGCSGMVICDRINYKSGDGSLIINQDMDDRWIALYLIDPNGGNTADENWRMV